MLAAWPQSRAWAAVQQAAICSHRWLSGQGTEVVVTDSEWPGCGRLPGKVCLQHVNVMSACWLGRTNVIKEQINA